MRRLTYKLGDGDESRTIDIELALTRARFTGGLSLLTFTRPTVGRRPSCVILSPAVHVREQRIIHSTFLVDHLPCGGLPVRG